MTTTSSTAAPAQPVANLPREALAFLPTPLHCLPRLSRELGIHLWLKRDDQTGLALGGNKARKLEFLMGDALANGFDTVITTGGTQSNHARMTAAACRQLGLDCYLVLDRGRHPENGNLILDWILGATVEMIEDPDPLVAATRMVELAENLAGKGKKAYIIPRGGSVAQGAVGYLNMVGELQDQLSQIGLALDHVYLATGSGGTHSGVMAGRSAFEATWQVQGISVSGTSSQQEDKVFGLSNEVLHWLGWEAKVTREDVRVDDAYVGPGYGTPTATTWEAIECIATAEGIILDPVYTGKAMAGLFGHLSQGRIEPGATVLFVHTGGAPALFGYAAEAESWLRPR